MSRQPNALFVSGPEAPLRALSEATQTIPIVVCAVDFDPGARGFVKRLAASRAVRALGLELV